LKEKQAELMKKIVDAKLREAKDEEHQYLEQFQAITPRIIALEDRSVKRGKDYL
jgi:hypothetical protein